MYTMECYSTIKKKEILPVAAIWMDLEGIMLSEMSHRNANNDLYVESKIIFKKLVNITKEKQINWYREQISGYKLGKGRGRGNLGVGN